MLLRWGKMEGTGHRTNDKDLLMCVCPGQVVPVLCTIIGAGEEGTNCAKPLETLPRAAFPNLLQSMTHLQICGGG